MLEAITTIQVTGDISETAEDRSLVTFSATGLAIQCLLKLQAGSSEVEVQSRVLIEAVLTVTGKETFQAIADLSIGATTHQFTTMGSGYVLRRTPEALPDWIWMSRCATPERSVSGAAVVMTCGLSLDFATLSGALTAVLFVPLDAT